MGVVIGVEEVQDASTLQPHFDICSHLNGLHTAPPFTDSLIGSLTSWCGTILVSSCSGRAGGDVGGVVICSPFAARRKEWKSASVRVC